MFGAVAKACDMVYDNEEITSSWKEDLESYIETNKESI